MPRCLARLPALPRSSRETEQRMGPGAALAGSGQLVVLFEDASSGAPELFLPLPISTSSGDFSYLYRGGAHYDNRASDGARSPCPVGGGGADQRAGEAGGAGGWRFRRSGWPGMLTRRPLRLVAEQVRRTAARRGGCGQHPWWGSSFPSRSGRIPAAG